MDQKEPRRHLRAQAADRQRVHRHALVSPPRPLPAPVTTFAPVATTATATTGDVRGSYLLQTASDGTRRFTVYQDIDPTDIKTTTGIFGVAQYGG